MKKKKKDRFRNRWLDERKTGKYWVPSASSTNDIRIAQEWANHYADDPTRQILDYQEKRALIGIKS